MSFGRCEWQNERINVYFPVVNYKHWHGIRTSAELQWSVSCLIGSKLTVGRFLPSWGEVSLPANDVFHRSVQMCCWSGQLLWTISLTLPLLACPIWSGSFTAEPSSAFSGGGLSSLTDQRYFSTLVLPLTHTLLGTTGDCCYRRSRQSSNGHHLQEIYLSLWIYCNIVFSIDFDSYGRGSLQ